MGNILKNILKKTSILLINIWKSKRAPFLVWFFVAVAITYLLYGSPLARRDLPFGLNGDVINPSPVNKFSGVLTKAFNLPTKINTNTFHVGYAHDFDWCPGEILPQSVLRFNVLTNSEFAPFAERALGSTNACHLDKYKNTIGYLLKDAEERINYYCFNNGDMVREFDYPADASVSYGALTVEMSSQSPTADSDTLTRCILKRNHLNPFTPQENGYILYITPSKSDWFIYCLAVYFLLLFIHSSYISIVSRASKN